MLTRDEFYREWIAALRSGEYAQLRYALRRPRGYCCLGVACDVAVKHGMGEWTAALPADAIFDVATYEFHLKGAPSRVSGTLPVELARLLEFGGNGDEISTGSFASRNDSGEWTFSEIADVLEFYAVSIGVEL